MMIADTLIEIWQQEGLIRNRDWRPPVYEYIAAIKVLSFDEGVKIMALYEHSESDEVGRPYAEQVDNFLNTWKYDHRNVNSTQYYAPSVTGA